MPTYKEADEATERPARTACSRPSRPTRASAGTRWPPAPTRPSTARPTTRSSARATRSRTGRRSRRAGVLQADTIANAAERAGKKVAQIDWVGGAAANINGPTVDFTTSSRTAACSSAPRTRSSRRARLSSASPTRSQRRSPPPPAGPASRRATRRPRRSRRRGRSTPPSPLRTRTARTTSTSTTAVNGGGVKYDHAIVSPVGKTGASPSIDLEGRRLQAGQADGRGRAHRRRGSASRSVTTSS